MHASYRFRHSGTPHTVPTHAMNTSYRKGTSQQVVSPIHRTLCCKTSMSGRICLQALQQRLVFEPLLEHQEQYSEDAVQPIDREDAATLTELLDKSLPVGSIQVNFGCLLTDKVHSVLPLCGRSQPGSFWQSSALFWAHLSPSFPLCPSPRTCPKHAQQRSMLY